MRWGFVGTGAIAGTMAEALPRAPGAMLAAVASRRLDTARAFAGRHGIAGAFDDWRNMLDSPGIDAVYLATPTSSREEIAVAAAAAGKHVLVEKPFASLPSLQRITRACRESGVCFMDATHFVHHPRHGSILDRLAGDFGRPRMLHSRFCLNLTDRGDIRHDPALEPLGALGDLGWYNLRATLEFLAPAGQPETIRASIRRDGQTGAITHAEGSLRFGEGSVSTWRCSFDAPSTDIGLELTGPGGRLLMENFVGDDEDGSASFRFAAGAEAERREGAIRIESLSGAPALMFEDFARAVGDESLRERWARASERTQALLDDVLRAAEGAGGA